MTARTFKIGNQEIVVDVTLDEVIDYNEEYGIEPSDENYRPDWIGLNTSVEIGNQSGGGQVQWDDSPNLPYPRWSLCCDGNSFSSDVLEMLRANFDEDDLFNDIGNSTALDVELQTVHESVCEFIIEVATDDY